ncbi:Transthyretin-like protein [Dirofilaria immitis]
MGSLITLMILSAWIIQLINGYFLFNRKQRVTVRGEIGCANNHDGYFEISGTEYEWGNIDAYLIIKHRCYQGMVNRRCIIIDQFPIPPTTINKIYNMGIISLDIYQKSRKTMCKKLSRIKKIN